MSLLKDATERGVLIVSVTQCTHGSVSGLYATGKALLDIGVIPGNDITPEAALVKLSYVLSKEGLDFKGKRRMMESNLVGEMTILNFKDSKQKELHEVKVSTTCNADEREDMDLIMAVANQLQCKTSNEMDGIREVLFPSILWYVDMLYFDGHFH